MPKKVNGEEEIKTGPPPGDSLAEDFGERPGIMLTGHPAAAEAPPEFEGDEEARKAAEAEEARKAEEAKPPEFTPKYKTHEEAERAHTEAERKMHEATTKASDLERERDELKQKLAEKEVAAPPEKPVEQPKPPSRDEQKARLMAVAEVANEKALEKIGDLDTTDPEYRKLVAKAWAEANAEALMEAGLGGVSQDAISKMVSEQVKATLKAEREAEAEVRKAEKDAAAKEDGERLLTRAYNMAEKAGLDMKSGSADFRLFESFRVEVPKDLRDQPLEEQVKWVTTQVLQVKGQVVKTKEELDETARKTQEENAILGRGGTRITKTPKTEDAGSLGSDFQEVRRERTLG